MLFTSYHFLGFIAVLFAAYYLVPKRFQWQLLLAFSYLFYFIAAPSYLLYIAGTTATVYVAARQIESNLSAQKTAAAALSADDKKAYKAGQKRIRICWVLACLFINFGVLAAVKYIVPAVLRMRGLALPAAGLSFFSLAVPMGISFYTLQAIGYLIDVYRGAVHAEQNPFKLALFISFFPQLIQGPISRFGGLRETLYAPHDFQSRQFSRGLQRVLWGFFKKLVIADRILAGASMIFGSPEVYSGAYVLVGMVLYTLQLYADFTGGIDIAIGIAEALGIVLPENFNRPYFSKSLKEYWRRWHISMSTWFRDYVFYPVSVSPPMRRFTKFSRRRFGARAARRLPLYVATFITWFATGLWHGSSWTFIVWGLLNWGVLMLSEELEPLYRRFHARFPACEGGWYRAFCVGRTFLLLSSLNLFDCYPSLSVTGAAFGSLFTVSNWHILWDGSLLNLAFSGVDYGILAAGVALLLFVSLLQRAGSVRDTIARRPYPARVLIWYSLFLVVLLVGAYGVGYDSSQFIYNRF